MASLDKISKFGIKQAYKKDDIVCIQGETGEHMYIVLKGKFRVYINSLTDFPIEVAEILPGQFFGEMSVLDDAPRSATVISAEDSLALSISKDDFRLLITEDGELAFAIMRTLSNRVRSANESLEKIRHTFMSADFSGTDTEQKSRKREKIAIMPVGSRIYEVYKPIKYDYFTEAKSIKCPVCESEFIAKIPVFSKLAQKDAHIQNDLRITYSNFDPIWYGATVCKSCNYANYYTTFSRISSDTAAKLKASEYSLLVEKYSGTTNSINSVIEAYYLIIHCNRMGEKNPETEAKTWLRLYWLYGDAGDTAEKLKAAERALLGYEKIVPGMDDYTKIQAYTIMAELSCELNNHLKAAAYYEQVLIDAKKNNAVLHRQAFSRLEDIKAFMEEHCV